MLRECKTVSSRNEFGYDSSIKVKEFITENQEDDDSPMGQELELNLKHIQRCKADAETFITNMTGTLGSKQRHIEQLEAIVRRERENSRHYRLKYGEALLQLRRTEEEKQRIMREYTVMKEKNEILMNSSYFHECPRLNRSMKGEVENESTML